MIDSCKPPTLVAITGNFDDIASRAIIPNGSHLDKAQYASAEI